ncbi:hypothetical protein N5J43_18420 [Pseudomonas nicosulfuronedens]|uniref:DUF6988 family protein n=1 Tax=Pseudomonas nicosulfuronedens TaxID=2571105 RepID=UPI00244D56CE|nr:hypothetical protein [Pseudomonas nicosulfuronedens]MDH1009634.1 hypothetical protein [Pseudomonas nicosulfuronedens]MDH1980933.1 hypothetical protein [Pseudomonas nicosulfuronedens]MDH2027806.1 hypothetical protein [Pseudomonas nicosulfuronedens]
MSMELDAILDNSDELYLTIGNLLELAPLEDSDRVEASFVTCELSLTHGSGLRRLIAVGNAVSATALLRLQFEALVRGIWLWHAANELQIEKITSPLTTESEQAAKGLPGLDEMIKKLANTPSVPPMAISQLKHFQDVQVKALNSYIHGGIHPLRRHAEGFPLPLALQVLKSSNGLAVMAAMMMAILTGSPEVCAAVRELQIKFKGCQPPLLYPAAQPSSSSG